MESSRAFPGWRNLTKTRDRDTAVAIRNVRAAAGPALRRWKGALRLTVVLLPTIAAGAYYGVIASDRFVSEAHFVIRTGSRPTTTLGGLNAILQLVGMARSQDDAYAVRDFLASRDAIHQAAARLPLREIYARPEADWITRYPSVVYGPSDEDFYRYFQQRVTAIVNETTGLVTLRVEAFRAGDAQQVAETLLVLGEDLVNRLNLRMQQDAVGVASGELTRAEQRRIDSQLAVTAFRNRELLLDPGKSAEMVLDLIGKLSTELADDRAQLNETRADAPGSPQMASLQERAAAVERQIAIERARVADNSDGLADKIAHYEQLMLQREFSIRALEQATTALEAAQAETRRQQLFLERVVEPDLPDKAMMPERWQTVLTVFGFNVVGFGIVWLIWTGLREHGMSTQR